MLHIARAVGVAVSFRALAAAALALLAACGSVTPPPKKSAFQPPTVVSKAVTFAPAAMDPDVEIDLLSRTKTPPAQLRVAWLQLQQKRVQNVLDATSEVLYGAKKPSAHEESFARYLRAEAFELSGQGDRGAYDRKLANQLAIDSDLRKLIAAKMRKTAAPVEAAAPATIEVAVQPRSAWGASAADRSNIEPMQPIDRVTIHHSAIYFRDTRPSTCGSQIAGIQRQHMTKNGWGDIGYHYLIDPSGRIWQGRELRFQGAHAGGDSNISNVGICLLGNFMRKKGQEPTRAQVQAMRQLVAELMRVYRFGPDAIFCHHNFKDTECPGELMTPIVSQMARDFRRSGVGRAGSAAAEQ